MNTSPGATIQPFCEPAITTSRPHSSTGQGIADSEEIASTISSRSWSCTTRAISGSMTFVTPVDVSLWVTSTARMSASAASASATRSGTAAVPTSNASSCTSPP